MKFLNSFIYLIIKILLIGLVPGNLYSQATATGENGIFYKISGNGLQQPSYLLGTYHLINDGFLKGKSNVLKRLSASENIIVETEIDSSKILMASLRLMMKDDSISGYLSPDEEKTVSSLLQDAMGINLKQVDRINPAALMAMLSMSYTQNELGNELNKISGIPIDMFIARKGHRENKNVIQLETMEEQMNLLYNGQSTEEQVEQLLNFANAPDSAKILTRKVFELYLNEDLAALNKLHEEEKRMYDEMDYLTVKRNRKWMQEIIKSIQSKPTFIAVGALHLPGDHGLIELLQKAGYNVTAESMSRK